jgi:ABC-type transport system substrate-binding protein
MNQRTLWIILLSATALVAGFAVGVAMNLAGARRPAGAELGGDTLRRDYSNDPDTINPITGNDEVSTAFFQDVYEKLADRDFANPDKWVGYLATGWQFDEKKLEYTIHLRKGVHWHPMQLPDGRMLPETEFTALDVKFTFDCILNPAVQAAELRSFYEDAQAKDPARRRKIQVAIVDKYTVKIRWTKPYMLATEWTLAIPIIPRHVFSVDEQGEPIALNYSLKEFADGFNQHWANTKMCGTGPLMFQRWTRNERLVLVRNPKYWGRPYPFARVDFRCIPNPNTSVEMLLQNDLDFAGIAEKDLYVQKKDSPSVIPGRMVQVDRGDGGQWLQFQAAPRPGPGHEHGTVKLVEYHDPGFRYIGYNLRKEPFRDLRFRQALAHAVPVRKIIDEVFKGLAIPHPGPFTPGTSIFNPRIKPLAYDLDESRRLLAEAGWKDLRHQGVLEKEIGGTLVPARFDLMIYADAPSFGTVAEIIKENWRKIGVDATISPTKWALMLQRLNNREFDACMLGWGGSWKEDPFQLWHGSQADEPYSSNFVSYRNARVDALIDQLRVTLDEKKQIPLYHQIDRLIYDDQPYTFLFAEDATAGYNTRLGDVRFYRITPCMNIAEWRLKAKP